ncbi:MAG: choice-of-anchor D domain-containing protein, partial [Calditrichaeota bacterium]|nr:choice-of-anchor D domain-containing protein [Calditrichota bacterium]
GHNLWVGGWGPGNIRIYDDGTTEAYWLIYDISSGTVESGADQNVIVTLDATGALDGDYEADMIIDSNAPNDPQILVNVRLSVQGAPDIEVSWDIGQDENLIDWNRYHRDLFTGGRYIVPVTIANTGTLALNIGSITSDNEFFLSDPDQLVIAARDEAVVNFIIAAREDGRHEGTMTIASDDPDEPEVVINLLGVTEAPPQIVVDPQMIEDDLNTGQTAEHVINIANDGAAPLFWEIDHEVIQEPDGGLRRDANGRALRNADGAPRRDPAGDLVAQFNGPNVVNQYWSPIGYDRDNDLVYLSSYSTSLIVVYTHNNYRDFQEVRRWAMPNPMDGCWMDGVLYANQHGQMFLHRWDANGNNLGNFNVGFQFYGVAADQENRRMFFREQVGPNYDIRVHQVDDNGNLGQRIGSISNWIPMMENNFIPYQIEWVFKHPEGQLWASNGNMRLNQIQINEDNWQAVRRVVSFPNGGANQAYDAVVHDGHHLWQGGFALNNFRIYEDGVTEVYWLGYDPKEGSIEAGGDVNVIVTLNAVGALDGRHEAVMNIRSNDPDDGVVQVSVILDVSGASDIELEWAIGQDANLIDFNRYHRDLFTGGRYPMPLTIRNVGTLALEGTLTTSDDALFSTDPAEFNIPVRQSQVVQVFIHAEEDGRHEGQLTIESNDPDLPEIVIDMVGVTGAPPVMVVDPQAIEDELVTGDIREYPINIANDGGAPLYWEAEHEIIREPEGNRRRDANGRSLRSADGGPMRDDPGDLIAQFNQPQGAGVNIYCSPVGYDRENDLAFITIYNSSILAVYTHDDYRDFREVRRWQATNPMDGGFYEGVVYICNLNQPTQVWRFDVNGNNIGNMNAGINAYGIAFDHEEGWCFIKEQAGNQPVHVYRMDGNNLGQRIGTINNWVQHAANNVNVYALEWVSKHPDGQLWIGQGGLNNNGNQNLYQVHINTENWASDAAVLNFPAGISQPYDAAAHDGYNLWVGGWGPGNIRIYDDGTTEAYWLYYDPSDGRIDPGGDANLIVTLNASGIPAGDYEASLFISSNDPQNEVVEVSIRMSALEAPAINGNPIPNPIVGAQPMVFPRTYVGAQAVRAIVITNTGSGRLDLDQVVIDNEEDFETDLNAASLQPGESLEGTVTFHPQTPNERQGRLTIMSNAENVQDGTVWWDLVGIGQLPASIATRPEAGATIRQGLAPGADPASQPLFIMNVADEGGEMLNWRIEVDENRDDGMGRRDASGRGLRNADGRGPVRDNPGDVLQRIQLAHPGNLGMGWDDENQVMWTSHTDQAANGWINGYHWNGQEITETEEFRPQGGFLVLGLTYNAGNIYCSMWANSWIQRYNTRGELLQTINTPAIVMGTAVDPERGYLFCITYPNVILYVLDINDNYRVVREIQNVIGQGGNADFRGRLTWVPQHHDGHLWMSFSFRAWQLNLDYEDWSLDIVQDFAADTDVRSFGIGHDGHNLWFGRNGNNNAAIVDDGRGEGIPWLTVDPMRGSTEAGGETEVTLTFDATDLEPDQTYGGTLTIRSNDIQNPAIEINVELVTGGFEPEHFQWVEGEANHSLLVTEATFDDAPLPSGWEIGVFSPRGVCSGAVVWIRDGQPHGFAAWGETDGNEQLRPNEAMSFRFWDYNAQREWAARPTIQEGPAVYLPNEFTALTLSGAPFKNLLVLFNANWNLISINVTPDRALWARDEGPDIIRMTNQLRIDQQNHHILLMKNERGQFYNPRFGFNNIPYWNLTEAYQVKMNEAVETVWSGQPIAPDADVPIATGWNFIAYFPDYQLRCVPPDFYAISPILNHVLLVKDVSGRFANPRFRFSNMNPWRETQGYQIKVDADVTLNYPEPQEQQLAVQRTGRTAEGALAGHWSDPAMTGHNMSVLITSIRGLKLEAGDQVAAFSPSGRLVGLGTAVDGQFGLAVWGDDPSTEAVEGLMPGEAFSLKVWSSRDDRVYDLNAAALKEGSLVYEIDGFAALDVSAVTVPSEFYLGQNYPNPFNSTTRLAYGLPEASRVKVTVYDVAGRAIARVLDREQVAGHYTIAVDGSGLTAGIYLVKVEAGSFSAIRKVMLVK